MIKRNSRYVLSDNELLAIENLQGIAVLLADRKGLTLAECFEAEMFSALDVWSPVNGTMRVIAKDGACWARVVGKTPLGNVILEPDRQPPSPAPAVPANAA